MENQENSFFLNKQKNVELFGALHSSDFASYTHHSSGLASFLTCALTRVKLSFHAFVYSASNFWCFGFRNRIKNSAKFIELRVSSYWKQFIWGRWRQEATSCSIDSRFIDKKATFSWLSCLWIKTLQVLIELFFNS